MIRKEELADGITLYLGDCREVLPFLPHDRVAVVSDPPYGINYQYGDAYDDNGGEAYKALLEALKPFPRCLLQYPEETMKVFVTMFGAPDEVFTWCYNANTARQSRLFSFWGLDVDFGRVLVPAKNPTDSRVASRVSSYDWTADFQQIKNVSLEKTDHPCQVPTALMLRIIRFIEAETIIDPFMGSGTTGVAAIQAGRKFTGIEIEPAYFDIARRRIEEVLQQPDMFATLPVAVSQKSIGLFAEPPQSERRSISVAAFTPEQIARQKGNNPARRAA